MKVILFLIFLLTFCQPKKKNYFLLENLVLKEPEPIYLFSYPGREVELPTKRAVLDHILQRIQNANSKIQIYAYSLNHPEILESLKKAKERGVELSFLLDSEKDYSELLELNFPIRIWKGNGLQHIKAMVFDEKFLFLGTGNFSRYGLTHDWNGYIDIPLTKPEYEDIIGELETRKSNYLIFISKFQFLFSPEQGKLIQNYILEAIENAKKSVKVLSFDHFDVLFSHVLKEASGRGVKVEMVQNRPIDEEGKYLIDEIFYSNSNIYRDGNTDRVFIEGNPFPEGGLLHHKTILIDEKILITGSYNFSLSARDTNRELFLVTKDKKALSEFGLEFERIKEKSYPEPMKYKNQNPNNDLKIVGKFPSFCAEYTIPTGIFEMGNGIFHSYLYFPTESNCIDFKQKHSISSGYSAFFSSSGKEFPIIWDEFNFYPRIGNERIRRKEFISLQKTHPIEMEFVKRTGLNRTYRIKSPITSRKFLFIAGRNYEWIESNDQNEITIGNNLTETGEGLLLEDSPTFTGFACFQKKEVLSPSLSYLIGRLWLQSDSKKETSCNSL